MACIDTCGSIGTYLKMAVEDSVTTGACPPATFDVNSERYEIISENVKYTDSLLGGNGLTGGLDPIAAHLRSGARVVRGRIVMEVGPNELAAWLPRILGNAAVGTLYETDEVFDLMPFDIMMNRDQATVTYRHCAVSRALFRSRASVQGDEQVMQMTLDIIGYEEHDTTWPSPEPPLPSTDKLYWVQGDGKLTLDTDNPNPEVEYYFDAFNLLIDNNLVPQVRNFLRVTCLQSRGRRIRLVVSTPYIADSHTNLYIERFDGSGTLSFLGTKNFVSGDTAYPYVSTFVFPRLVAVRQTPETQGPGEIPLSLDLTAYRTSTAEPISITNSIV